MNKLILTFFVLVSFLNADKVLQKSLACPSIMLLKKAPLGDDYLGLNLYAISNNCVILSKNSKIQAIGYDPQNKKVQYQEILYKNTGAILYMLRSQMQVEQGGKKSTYRF